MEILSEIAHFLRSNLSKSKPLGYVQTKRDRTDVFYEKLIDGDLKTDNEAALFFYGRKGYNYSKLKARTLDNLITSVLLLDFNNKELHSYSKKYYAMIREMTVAKLLLLNGYYRPAIFLAQRCYKKSEELGYYDVVAESVRMLKNHYGARLRKEVESRKYQEKLVLAKKIIDLEDKAQDYYANSLIFHKKNRANLAECNILTVNYYSELSPYLKTCHSLKFQMMTRYLRTIVNASKSDFYAMVSDSQDDIDYFNNHHKGYSPYLRIFLQQKAVGCMRLGRYREAEKTIKESLKITRYGATNWFSDHYYLFFVYMQSERYSEAEELYLRITSDTRYKSLVEVVKENWIVGGAYLNYVIEKGLLKTEKRMKFRVGKFLNEVPEYSKDRRVKNIPILIAQILFMLHRKQTGKAIDRIESIKQYCGRNLRYNEAVRSNSFIMALMEIPKCSFNKIAVTRRIERYVKRLKEVPLHQSGKNFDLELISYERLLGYAIESL